MAHGRDNVAPILDDFMEIMHGRKCHNNVVLNVGLFFQ
jgi:hypothetical protein